jgi:putative toxin-antitoxin system antitoxin component (TIGR02293 family)
MNIKGNTKLKTNADGLRVMERKLAVVIAHIARAWLYLICINWKQSYVNIIWDRRNYRQMSYICMTNVGCMKKTEKRLQLKDFDYAEFRKIADKAPFTQSEWASMLHVSERTLQRYAKSNGSFAPINAERAMQIAEVLTEGKKTFGKTEQFYKWMKSSPATSDGVLTLDDLNTAAGIQLVRAQLGRIQHGILA